MKTFSNIIIIAIFFFLSTDAISQGRMGRSPEQREQLETQRIAFITQELALTTTEAQKFWPIYNAYSTERKAMMMEHRGQRMAVDNLDNLSEQEIALLVDAEILNMEEMTALRRKYHELFKSVLPYKKVILLYEAERNFNRQLYREGRHRQGAGGRGRN